MGRKNARRVKNITGMNQLMVDIKPDRCDSDVFINQEIDVTNLVKYVEDAKKKGKELTFFHAFMMAMGKVIYNRDKLNRFIANRHVFEHDSIVISFVAKVAFEDHAEEMMILIPFDENDTLDTISKKIRDKVDSIRNKKEEKKGANSAIDTLAKLPNILRIPVVGLLKWMDDKGILPASLMEDNLYYSSAIVSNLGSLKCGAIYHNITNFGACSSLTTIGEIRNKEVIDENGKKKNIKYCEFGMNIDERIADGYYFVKSLHLLQYILDNPKLLEKPINQKVEVPKK